MTIKSILAVLLWFPMISGCTPGSSPVSNSVSPVTMNQADTVSAKRLFEENIDAIHKRNRPRYLATYLRSPALARNGPAGLQLGYDNWSALSDTTWPDTLVATGMRVVPLAPGVVYGTYCYSVTQAGTTTSGVSERVFVHTASGWKIAVTTAFGLPAGAAPQCK